MVMKREESHQEQTIVFLQSRSQQGLPLYALGWADRKVKTIISNVGSTNPGSTSNCLRHKNELVGGVWETTKYYKEIRRPL